MPSAYDALLDRLYDVNALNMSIWIMDWDQQTYMPPGGGEARAEHCGRLARMAHEAFVSDETQKLLAAAEQEGGDELAQATLRVVRRDMAQRTKIPASLVAEKSGLASRAHEEWVQARANDNFAGFAPTLDRLFDICRQEADYLGYTDHPYDALTDLYEEGATKAGWDAMFDQIRQPLTDLTKRLGESGNQADNSFLFGDWDKGAQMAFTKRLSEACGFNFSQGRQDTAAHPFCTNFAIHDVRLTTRFLDELTSSIFGTLHETGHGLYEQNSPIEWDRQPLAGGVSLGVHESQSRLWENIVGRSKGFWKTWLPELKKTFPAIGDVSLEQFHRAVNRVEPSLIRVEADEVTYNLHIMVRYEAECDLLTQKLKVKDLPDYWNAKYEKYLGITPPNDRQGCLQDVHWSGGSVGYFPTYSMGNLLSFQIWEALTRDLGDGEQLIESGRLGDVLDWLRENVYRHGRRFTPKDLIKRATGKELTADAYLAGITKKYEAVYGLTAGV
ncbi:MAG: carboxypeptidase M32 [Fimbriimonadaceae bacterium]|nr:carboxypeptidase M32 [Fimbriimonadaceae bacterium]